MTFWSQERVQILIDLAPTHSASKIAEALGGGCTRNAVIGKAQRTHIFIGRPAGVPKISNPTHPVTIKASVPKPPPAPPPPPPPPKIRPKVIACEAAQPVEHVIFADLEPHHCRWPVAFGYCGASKIDRRYCAAHAKMSARP